MDRSIKKYVLFVMLPFTVFGCETITVSELPANKYNHYKNFETERWAADRVFIENDSTEAAIQNSVAALKCKYRAHEFYSSENGRYIYSNTGKLDFRDRKFGYLYLLMQLEFLPSVNETEIDIRWLIVRKLPKESNKFYVEMTSEQDFYELDVNYIKESAEEYRGCGA